MPSSKAASDCGWFYHAPPKRREQEEPVAVPPTSQIPGLNEATEEPYYDPIRPLYKDTDTKYIRLAKQGGRQELLKFKGFEAKQKDAVGYPRPDWFYLEDNALEDANTQSLERPYDFLLPEYMVHEAHRPSYVEEARHTQADKASTPFANDGTTVYQREGRRATDKTVKLPEICQPGYGIRRGKPLKASKPSPEKTKPHSAPDAVNRQSRIKYKPIPQTNGNTTMNKLLSYGYDKDWHDEVEKWEKKQDIVRQKAKVQGNPVEPLTSVYKDTIGKDVLIAAKLERFFQHVNGALAKNGNASGIMTKANRCRMFGMKNAIKLHMAPGNGERH
ncbi:hypothetical protein ScPMuIL_017136 [Solemya velum]